MIREISKLKELRLIKQEELRTLNNLLTPDYYRILYKEILLIDYHINLIFERKHPFAKFLYKGVVYQKYSEFIKVADWSERIDNLLIQNCMIENKDASETYLIDVHSLGKIKWY